MKLSAIFSLLFFIIIYKLPAQDFETNPATKAYMQTVLKVNSCAYPKYSINTRPIAQPGYSNEKVNKNLRLDRRLIISGSTLTGFGGIAFITGIIFSIPGKATTYTDTIQTATGPQPIRETHKSMGTFIPFSMFMLGACTIATGIPLLGVGLAQRHKWRNRQREMQIETGILSNARLGFAMNF